MNWTQNKLYHPQKPQPTKPRKQAHRHNREFISVLARSTSGRQYLAERLNYTDKGELADDIALGQVYDAMAVFAWNPVECWAKDISEEIALDIVNRHGMTRSSVDFLEDHLGIRRS